MLLRRAGIMAAILAGLYVGSGAAGATRLKTDLQRYLERVRALYPEAEVVGGFNDWRTVSIYRSHAGLHLGYDIALHAGRAVPVGWSGRVVDIVPWTSTEYGVCVELAGGYRITYGHLLNPTVALGQIVTAGQTVGTVAHDHVDIKVRDRSGGYLDWGLCYGVLQDTASDVATGGLLPPPPYATGGAGGAGSAPDLTQLYHAYRHQRTSYELCRLERDRLQNVVSALSVYIDNQSAGLPEAEQQMLAWYRAADRHQVSDAQVEAMNLALTARRGKVNRLIHIMEGRQSILAQKESALRQVEADMNATLQALNAAPADPARLRKIEALAAAAARKAAQARVNPDIARRAEEARTRMVSYQARYQSGGVARTRLEDAVQDYQRLHLVEVLWERGDEAAASGLMW